MDSIIGRDQMDTFDIQDEEIDVQEIMRKIRENIKKRKESGAYPRDGWDEANDDSYKENDLFSGEYDHLDDLEKVRIYWDIKNSSYRISSHQTILGAVLRKGRELVHGEVRRYLDPIVGKQIEFNRSTARLLSRFEARMDQTTEENYADTEYKKGPASDAISMEVVGDKSNQESKSDKRFGSGRDGFDLGSAKADAVLESGDARLNYPKFEERFRGSREEIKKKQSAFVHYFDQCKNVLNFGCWRGEFLELLQDQGIGAHGVDLDADLVSSCKSRGLSVEQNDAISYLSEIEDESLDGIFIDHVIEHLPPNYLVEMLVLCHKKIKPNYYIIIEAVNPLSLFSLINFNIDIYHKKPVHPETLQFLLESCGFKEIETKFITPVSEDMLLKKIAVEETGIETFFKKFGIKIKGRKMERIEIYNNNINILNKILYGAQDYVIIGNRR